MRKKAFSLIISVFFLISSAGCSQNTAQNSSAQTSASSTVESSTAVTSQPESTSVTEIPSQQESTAKTAKTAKTSEKTSNGVTVNGQLSVNGVNLVNEAGKTVQLKGMSSHGMQWFPQFTSTGALKSTRDFGANVFRIAMYTDEGGYLTNPEIKKTVFEAADRVIALDMYVIIDWHILHDNNPQSHKSEAKTFFAEASKHYANNPAVLYEICNEPNGDVKWNRDIKPYAQEVIPIIRANAPKAVVIVGTGTWSQDIQDAADSPLAFQNVMYACHFYAGTHGQFLRDRIDYARKKNAAIFVSEWGTSAADGSGGVFIPQSQEWLNFLSERKISWINWSLADKSETSAALKPGASPNGGWAEKDLSQSGSFVFKQFK